MRKRLLCVLMAVCMIGSSVTAYAAELEERPVDTSPDLTEESDKPEQVEETEYQEDMSDTDIVPEVIPQASQEPDQIPEETQGPDIDVVPDAEPTAAPEETQDIESVPNTEPTQTPDIDLSPETSIIPEISPSPSTEPVMILEEDDELVGAIDFSKPITGEVTSDSVEVAEKEVLTFSDGAKLTVRDSGNLTCSGTIQVEPGAKASIVKNNGYFYLYEGASIAIGKNGTLTVSCDIGFYEKSNIFLDEGAALIIEGNMRDFSCDVSIGKDSQVKNGDEDLLTDIDNLFINEGAEVALAMKNSYSGTITAKKNSKVTLTTEGDFSGHFATEEGATMQVTAKGGTYTFSDEINIPKGVTLDLQNGTLTFRSGNNDSDSWVITGGGTLIVAGDYEIKGKNETSEGDEWSIKEGSTLTIKKKEKKEETTRAGEAEESGTVNCAGTISIDETSTLNVDGDYIQSSGCLKMLNGGGTVNVGGDFRIQKREKNPEWDPDKKEGEQYIYSASDGCWSVVYSANSILNIDGSFITQAKGFKGNNYNGGTIIVGKDLIQLDSGSGNDEISGNNTFTVVLKGKEPHMISLEELDGKLNYLELREGAESVTMDGCLNAKLLSDCTILLPEGKETLQTSGLILNKNTLTVNGNVEVDGKVDLGKGQEMGGHLIVHGNYQSSADLKVNGGTVDIDGDCLFLKKESDGSHTAVSGTLNMGNSLDRVNIGGDFCMKTSNSVSMRGTMAVGGDIIQETAGGNDKFHGAGNFRLILNGSEEQKISLSNPESAVNYLQLDNKNVTAEGYLNAIMASNGTLKTKKETPLIITGMNLDDYTLTIDGDAKATGNIRFEGNRGKGKLVVTGNHVQESGCLRIGEGTMEVGGSLLLQRQNESGNYVAGTGYLEMTNAEGALKIEGDLIMESSRSSRLSAGTINLAGDLKQISGQEATGYLNSTSSHKLILDGTGPQKIELDSTKSKVGTLQLTQDKSNYTFDPEKVIKMIVEPLTSPDPSASTKPSPSVEPSPSSKPSPSAKPSSWPFDDVEVREGNWKYDNIKFVYEKGIMTGLDSTTFQPDASLTRAQFASVIYRMAGEPKVSYKNTFSDVPAGKWFSNAIIWAYENGIVAGLGNGTYGTEDKITREQMSRMLMEFARVQKYSTGDNADFAKFADASQVSRWATDYMRWAVGSGIISGSTKDGKYYMNPKGQATRAECAVMLTKFIQKYQ